MPDLSRRSSQPELMDQGGISFAEFHQCLQGLETINRLTLAYRPTLRWLRRWTRSGQPICLLDAGSGGGDMLRRIEKQAATGSGPDSVPLSLIGVDLNPLSKKSAELCSVGYSIRFLTDDIFAYELDQPIDIIVCNLFTHHLDDDQLVDFLCWIDSRARHGWFINDLHRHPIPFYFIKIATRLFSRNRLIRHDAAVSVARSFTADDWHRLLAKAGLTDRVRVQWFFPFRLCLSSQKGAIQHDA